jgi:para-nitrobenzyl esterase
MRSLRIFKLATALAVLLAQTTVGRSAAPDPRIINFASGMLRGTLSNGVLSFKDIPYARPPVGNLRWRPPQPAHHWRGVRDATKFGPECMQTDNVPKSEDCLTLNVWKPAAAAGPLPVMVWIYGGALVHGQTSLYPADNLARQGIIVVSMNYRMGRFGFFAHPALLEEKPRELHGNYGYMDQRAALQWVQRNIAAFGGDPKQVTIFGESAGGGSVLTHLTSPLSHRLFARAILESPGIPTPRAKVVGYTGFAAAQQMAVDYAKSLGVDGSGRKTLKALRALSAEKLTEGTDAKVEVAALSAGRPISGVAGSMIDGKLVVGTPSAAIASGNWAKVPIMVGANDRDLPIGAASSKDELFALFGDDANLARSAYDPAGDQSLDELKQQVFADRTMTEPARYLADLVARGGGTAYLYRFSYVAEALRGNPAWQGTPHGLEIPYVFDLPAAIVKDKVTAADKKMAETTSAYWIAFAKTGDPNGGGRPQWPKYHAGVDAIINFTNSGVTVGPDPIKARLDLWAKVWSHVQ